MVLRIGSADFLHCWITDSMFLEWTESLITMIPLNYNFILHAWTRVVPCSISRVNCQKFAMESIAISTRRDVALP